MREGERFQLSCHEEGCKRYLTVVMGDESMGYAYHKKFGRIDLRNQVWYCHQHGKKSRGKNRQLAST